MRLRYVLIPAAVVFAVAVGSAGPAPAGGGIEGKVTYTGTPPKMKPIDMSKEPTCQKEHNPPELTQNVATGPENALQYVVVYVSAGEKPSETPSETVRFDQKGCMYLPHILPMHSGQALDIYTNDPFAHNIHPMPKHNPEWNKSQPPGAPPIVTKWETPEFIEVKCNIHPWMHGYFAVLNTNHYAVTDSSGNFTLKDVPPGKYTLTAWQEQYGTQSQEVTVGETPAKVSFVFKVTPYLY
jgi:Carboxypeptidase regulatory-like domain